MGGIDGACSFQPTRSLSTTKNDFKELQDPFIQEMRRYYPFFPMLPAFALQDVEVDGYRIPKDSWVILDLYGTNHDERTVDSPEAFLIKRYIGKAKKSLMKKSM